MKKLALVIGLLLVALTVGRNAGFTHDSIVENPAGSHRPEAALRSAFESQASGLQVMGSGEVVKVLADDNKGSRHQRFILRTTFGQTILVAHNIDLADRLDNLKVGDQVEFNGEYEWNEQGGVIHWTHHDPQGRHVSGWLKHNGRKYE